MKDFFKKITGIKQLEEEKVRLEEEKVRLEEEKTLAEAEAVAARQAEELAKLSPKDRATAKKEPWVAVLDTHVNKENIRNGFFELDWNEYFVLQLRQAGYGFEGDPEEEIVDRWFRELCSNVANEEGIDMTDRGAGFINVRKISEGKSEVS
jgi:hypothetical protein